MKAWIEDVLSNIKADLSRAHTSLVIWFNGAVGTAIVILPEAQASFPQLQDYLPADAYRSIMGLLVVGNILLRFKTASALRDK